MAYSCLIIEIYLTVHFNACTLMFVININTNYSQHFSRGRQPKHIIRLVAVESKAGGGLTTARGQS